MFVLLAVNILIACFIVFVLLSRKNANRELEKQLAALYALLENATQRERQEQLAVRQELSEQNHLLREELANNFQRLNDFLLQQLALQNREQREQLEQLSKNMADLLSSNTIQQEKITQSVAQGLKQMQESNEQKLDAMRMVVDEKLNTTLTRRLDESFKTVGDQLQQLYKSLGEMQSLSSGVQSLNRVLTNVKARGAWGEVQLGALLEQVLAPEQYEQNVAVKRGAKERVEFAVKLPGHDNEHIWLPLDAKFSQEDYLRLSEAAEAADPVATAEALRALENRVKMDARTIRDKYINPPATTDFAVMFLPTEGLYAEVLRINGLAEYCQRECHIMIAGPTTLAALLNSLRMGFSTLAIEKKSGEVWKLLGAIKKQYAAFDQLIDKSLLKLEDAQQNITAAKSRSHLICQRLNKVEELDFSASERILSLDADE